jgi:hypothetical protein
MTARVEVVKSKPDILNLKGSWTARLLGGFDLLHLYLYSITKDDCTWPNC